MHWWHVVGWTELIQPPSRGVYGDVHFRSLWTQRQNATLGPVGLEGVLRAKALSVSGELYLSLPDCKRERKGNKWAPANVLGDGLEGS